MPPISHSLKRAYEATQYHIFGPFPVTFTVATEVGDVNRWLDRMGCAQVTVITAWNPFSVEASVDANAAAQSRLTSSIEGAGRWFVEAEGRSPDGQWVEQSVCVLGADDDEIDAWLVKYGQNAALQVTYGSMPTLVWHPMYRLTGGE